MTDYDPGGVAEFAPPPLELFMEPTREMKREMRKAAKRPSEWLRLLAGDWAVGNEAIVEMADQKFIEFKPYLKGILTSQLLCRLSAPVTNSVDGSGPADFWRILGIMDEFDKAYIVAQVERFCVMYNIRGLPEDAAENVNHSNLYTNDLATQDASIAAAAGISVSPTGGIVNLPFPHMEAPTAVAAAAAAAAVTHHDATVGKLSKKQVNEVSRAHRMAKDAEKALEQERRQNLKKEQKRLSQERKEQKQREREAVQMRRAQERSQREASREDRRKKKLEIRMQREKFAQEQKDLALKRAAELVNSNRVPIEITRGAAAAKAAANAALAAGGHQPVPEPVAVPSKKPRSAIVVSTAADLHQIVTHSKNLWAKYNAIAKEHNQKVNWITVAKELGIHVKVREKYARMHSRAEQRGFDWQINGHFKIKDHPEIFIEPTESEQKAKMPLPPPDTSTTVLIAGNKEVSDGVAVHHHPHHQPHEHHQPPQQHNPHSIALEHNPQPPEHPPQFNHHPGYNEAPMMVVDGNSSDDAASAAARVVDAAVTAHHHPVDTLVPPSSVEDHSATAAAAAVAASLVADPTANLMHHHEETYHHPPPTVA
ncbi:expressed unknown protein [Seminavis robusta]|uniref:Uncharacterized protein n=1 Tax=Seminavis robusta TaxID=568900 RepID=A0A9N8E744_9STRA|nr:expressed unknown protein [Seminavis robusta]|eukprot:Sro693_g188230.1 n/a (596) ;mRNA; r:11033-13155